MQPSDISKQANPLDYGISAEELKATGEPGVRIIHKLCNRIWDTGEIPQDWGRAVIVPIYKKKDKLDCSNYRGISLLSLAGKVFCSILHKRMQTQTEDILAESQAGFRPGRSTIDQLFTLRQLAEKYSEKRKPLYCCYIDYQKAFDTVWQEGLWQAMRHLGYSSKTVDLLRALYGTSQSTVRVNGELTPWFTTMTGVRQGCILSPQLFNILLELVLRLAIQDEQIGAKVQGQYINNLRFADDIVLLAETKEDLQFLVTRVNTFSKKFGLTINISKTEVQVINREKVQLDILIDGKPLKQVEDFIYLGGVISETPSNENDIKRRIGLAMGSMQKLNPIWKSKDIKNSTKLELYRVLVLSIITYSAETWTLKKSDEQRLRVFEMACLRKILGVTRRDRIRNTNIRERLRYHKELTATIMTKKLKYFGHVKRMSNSRYPKILLEGHIEGNRPRGRPEKKWLEDIKHFCTETGIPSVAAAGHLATNRQLWRLKLVGKPSPGPTPGGRL